MNWNRSQVNATLGGRRRGAPPATVLLRRLYADHHEIQNVIRHLQRLRDRRLHRFGTLEVSLIVRVAESLGNMQAEVRIAQVPGRDTG